MSDEMSSKELPAPVATTRPGQRPGKLSKLLVLATACVLCYLGLASRSVRHHAAPADPLVETSLDIELKYKLSGLNAKQAESIFLSVPSPESAISVSRAWTAKPHLAGSSNDYTSAREQLEVFQKHFGIEPPKEAPVFDAGTAESRQSILSISNATKPIAWIDTYYSMLNTPAERKLEIINEDGSAFWSANVEETPAEGDPAGRWHATIGAWHGLSKGGDVQGKLVYANYGSKKDFDDLAAAGHNLTGTIALVRYGEVFRGLKVKAAQEAGAVGCLIYSDPRDNGVVTTENGYESWPNGPAMNPDAVQRGSVLLLSDYPGDPTTPGYPSYRGADRTEALNVPSIPSLPLSWSNARVLINEIGDDVFSERKIRLLNGVNNAVTPIWNTMAVIPGHIRNEVVVVGNHRDAWVLGAADPTSGTVSMHEVTKGLGELLKKGWKPLRTIVFASWDAEEYGLIGSTEWGEDFADWIQDNAVAYINVDVSTAGDWFGASSSPSLAHLIRQSAIDIPHPSDTNRTLWDARKDGGPFTGPADKEALKLFLAEKERQIASETGISPLGSGSDFTVFLQRLGIASADVSFHPTPTSAVYHYHSIWDSFTWMEKYGDPGFLRHVAVSKHMGLMVLRLVDSIVVPLNTTQYALELGVYLDRVLELSAQMTDIPDFANLRHAIHQVHKASIALDHRKAHAERHLRRVLEKIAHRRQHKCSRRKFISVRTWVKKIFGVYEDTENKTGAEIKRPHRWLKDSSVNPRIGGAPAWAQEQERAKEWNGHAYRKHEHSGHGHDSVHHGHGKHGGLRKLVRAVKEVQAVNKKLSKFEQGFLSEDGILNREWYRHLGVAPGRWLGYGATTLPALTEAITIEKNATLVAYEADRLTALLRELADNLKQ